MWAGSDDGLVHVTRDHGKTWTNVTPPDIPDLAGSARSMAPRSTTARRTSRSRRCCWRSRTVHLPTRDYGRTSTKIVTGITANDYVHTVREDPVRRGLLYAGTQHGAYVSFDDRELWRAFKNGIPDTPVSDLVVENSHKTVSSAETGTFWK